MQVAIFSDELEFPSVVKRLRRGDSKGTEQPETYLIFLLSVFAMLGAFMYTFCALLAEETLGGELALLDHPARHVFIFKKKQTGDQVEVITRRLTDTECLTRHLRFDYRL